MKLSFRILLVLGLGCTLALLLWNYLHKNFIWGKKPGRCLLSYTRIKLKSDSRLKFAGRDDLLIFNLNNTNNGEYCHTYMYFSSLLYQFCITYSLNLLVLLISLLSLNINNLIHFEAYKFLHTEIYTCTEAKRHV